MSKEFSLSKKPYMVYVSCTTYNHANYIKDALRGFYIQKTNFPFAAIVIDDASTDNEQEVLLDFVNEEIDLTSIEKEETEDYIKIAGVHKENKKCTFVLLLLKYNHNSIKKAKSPYFEDFHKGKKYAAICEGDDYWIDPLKLQKQMDFLESHPNYTMVCNRTILYSEKKKKYIGENYCYNHNGTVKTKDVIYRSGLFISTCSILYRKSLQNNYPDYCRKCAVGDYPLQIMAAMKGHIYYFNDAMSVYRIDNSRSWSGKQKWRTADEKNLRRIESMLNMFKGFSDNYPSYKKYFSTKIAQYLISQCPYRDGKNNSGIKLYKKHFKDYFDKLPLFWIIIFKLSITNIPILRGYYTSYTRPLFKKFKVFVYIYR